MKQKVSILLTQFMNHCRVSGNIRKPRNSGQSTIVMARPNFAIVMYTSASTNRTQFTTNRRMPSQNHRELIEVRPAKRL